MKEKKPKCTKLYDAGFGLLLVLLMYFTYATITLEKASDGAKRPVTKANLTEAIGTIKPAKTYNQD